MLRITPASEPISVEQIVLVIYSLPGIGKTTLGFTADKPILYDFDKGSHRAGNRKDTVLIQNWSDITETTQEDLAPYSTIVVDTAGRALDCLTSFIIEENPKNARGSGDLTLQGFGVLKGKFIGWLKLMRSYGKDVVLISHMDEKTEGDILKERLDVQGGSKAEIYKSADAICKLYIDGKTRKLDFSPREGSLGKNPAQFEILTVPDYRKKPEFLAQVISDIKGSINKLSEEQKQKADLVAGWTKRLEGLTEPEQFNILLPELKASSEVVKALAFEQSKRAGLKFNKEANEFYRPAVEPKPETAPAPAAKGDLFADEEPPAEAKPAEPPLIPISGRVSEIKSVAKPRPHLIVTVVWQEDPETDIALPVYVWSQSMQEALRDAAGLEVTFGTTRTVKDEGTSKEKVFYAAQKLERLEMPKA